MKHEHLVGLPYNIRTSNCFTIMRQFYKDNWNIEIRNYAAPSMWWITNPELNLYMKHVKDEGFIFIDVAPRAMLPGDLLLMANQCPLVNHTGAYLGNNRFLHHPFRSTSKVELYAGHWRDRTMAIARHPDVSYTPPSAVQFIDLLSPQKQEQYRALLNAHIPPIVSQS